MEAKLEFVSVGANRVAGCTDWGVNNLFAYAGGKFVVLYDIVVSLFIEIINVIAKQSHSNTERS
jgi:hypothetical protein